MTCQEVIHLGSFEPEFTRDPYPFYATLRQSAPVCPVVIHGLQGWLLTRYEDVKRALNDASLSNDRRSANPSARSASWLFADEPFNLQHHMLRSDPPRHTRIRRAVSPAFSARQAERLRPRIEQIANELIDRFAGLGHTELISSYAFPLPLMVIMEILGIPAGDRAQLHAWSDILSSGSAASESDIAATLTNMRAYFHDAVKEGRYSGGGDSLLDVLAAGYRDHIIDEAEFLSSAFQLLQGGHVTTLGMIANSVLALLNHPEQMAAMRRNPNIAGSAIEELLRFDSPMEIATIRFTTRPVQFGRVTIAGDGQPLILAVAAANRDPARFADPNELDLLRDSSGHLAFAYGPHYCLGAHLARVEAAIGVLALIDRLDDMVLAVGADELQWRPNPHLRRPEQLPIAFTAPNPSILPATKEATMAETGFRKSSFCTDAHGCVEVRIGPSTVEIRDAKKPDRALLTFDRGEWDDFVAGVKAGEFDR